jgi:hypothetical protein
VSQEAEEWVLRNFKGKPAEKAILLAMAGRADGCIVSAKIFDLTALANTSARDFYRCVGRIEEELGELRRLSPRRGGAAVRVFHLERFCSAKLAEGEPTLSLLCPRKESHLGRTLPDIRNIGITLPDWQSRSLPFPRMGFSRDKCEECRGTGFKLIPRPDGQPGKVAIPCAHRVAAIAGCWKPMQTLQDDLLPHALPKENEAPTAEQQVFDWARAAVETQKAGLEKWLREHPDVRTKPEEEALPANVVVMRRKSA